MDFVQSKLNSIYLSISIDWIISEISLGTNFSGIVETILFISDVGMQLKTCNIIAFWFSFRDFIIASVKFSSLQAS
jgi:hypothetical protein